MKKWSDRRKHCALAVVRRSQKFSPRCRLPSPGQDGQNLIRWRWSLPSPTDQFDEDRCTQFQVIMVTEPQTYKPTNTHKQTGLIMPLSLARSVIITRYWNQCDFYGVTRTKRYLLKLIRTSWSQEQLSPYAWCHRWPFWVSVGFEQEAFLHRVRTSTN